MEDDQSGSDQEDDQLIPALDKPKKTYINDEVLHFIMAYTWWIIFKFWIINNYFWNPIAPDRIAQF